MQNNLINMLLVANNLLIIYIKYKCIVVLYAIAYNTTIHLRPQLHDTGFVSERHQFKVFSSLVCSYNFLYLKLLFNYVIIILSAKFTSKQ
jgi:hypothetical protein